LQIIKEGSFRYTNSTPPGYKDKNDKVGFQMYGDLILWKQIIHYAKEQKKPIIFVTNDNKDDWWSFDKDKNAPRSELIMEIWDFANVNFWMFNSKDFFRKAKTILNAEIDDETIETINEVEYKQLIKYYILNTNKRYDTNCETEMLNHNKAAAYYNPWKYNIDKIKKSDIVFLYSNGKGIIAGGIANGILGEQDYEKNKNEEHFMKLDNFNVLEKPIRVAKIKEIAEKDYVFMSTMFSIDNETGEILWDMIKNNKIG